MLIDSDGDIDKVPLHEFFFNPPRVREEGIEVFLRGVSTQLAQEIDLAVVDQVRNKLFGPPGSADHKLRRDLVRSGYPAGT
jgi:hypothetical protein